MPGISTIAAGRSAFDGVAGIPAGHRLDLAPGEPPRLTETWRPTPRLGDAASAAGRFAAALRTAVDSRVDGSRTVTCDLSGGLDSTSLARLAGQAQAGRGRRAGAITMHPAGVLTGGDLDYARVGGQHPGIDHRWLARDDRHLPYTGLDGLAPVDEPAPGTVAVAFWLRQLRFARDELGSTDHLTGDGGDTLLCPPLIYLADLIRSRRPRRAVADAIGWATLYRTSAIPLLRSAARTARTSRAQALRVLARQASNGGGSPAAAVADWYSPPSGPPWATALLRSLAAEAIGDAAAAAEQSLDPVDASAHIAWENIIEIGRTAAADGHLAHAATGVVQHNPFADSAVVAAALSCPSSGRADPHRFKPLLIAAFPDLLPPAVTERSTKGDSTSDHIRGLRTNLPRLQETADGHLAGHGLLDPQGLRELLTRAAAGIPAAAQLIQPAIATETWLQSLMNGQPPKWTTIAAAEAVEARTS